MYYEGMFIGAKQKEKKYKEIIQKLLKGKGLSEEDKEFLKKQGVQI